ncbi:hypothetical protein [Paenibacillus sp. R14(2021)]|uniref:hypothetical protein n=1 Tax=Paenibacillus sp. R14(2021) TaxID=2859228 RepID=UPI001C613B62|nr:hypothetical protein [Paenibacillus sp. R14(2021)]
MLIQEDSICNDFLRRALRYYESISIPAKLLAPTEEEPYTSLIIRFSEIGERSSVIDLEMSFLPGLEELNQAGVYLYQAFAVLAGQTNEAQAAQLHPLLAAFNLQLPLGSFGVFPDGGALYLKQTAMLDRTGLLGDGAVKLLDQQNGVLLHQLHQFTDKLLAVSNGSAKHN